MKERKKWRNSSASQIKNFKRCPRKWWWEKVAGFTQPPSPAMLRGTRIHAELEAYLKTGKIPTNPIALAGLEYLPDPADVNPADVERRINLRTANMPVPIIGFVDLVEPATNTITDHKTTSDFKYAKAPEELAYDPQAIIYGTEALTKYWRNAPDVTFRHVYYRTRGRPDSRESIVVLKRAELAERFADIVETIHDQATAHSADIADLEPNLDACADYGGCPYRSNCAKAGGMGENTGIFAGIQNNFSNQPQPIKEKQMGIFDRIKERKETQAKVTESEPLGTPAAAQAPSINPPDGTPADFKPEPAPQQVLMPAATEAKIEQEAPAATKAKPATDGPYFPTGERARGLKAAELFPVHAANVEAMAPGMLAAWTQETKLLDWHAADRPMKAGQKPKRIDLVDDCALMERLAVENIEANLADIVPVIEVLSDETPAPEHYGKQAPALSEENRADEEFFSDVLVEALETEIKALKRKLAEKPAGKPAAIRTLYIGCHPRNGASVYLETILAPYQRKVADAEGVAHHAVIEYGKGDKYVGALLAHEIRQGTLTLPAALIADRRLPGTAAALEVLLQHYPQVVERHG